MINEFTVSESGSYRCTATPLDGHSAIALLAIGHSIRCSSRGLSYPAVWQGLWYGWSGTNLFHSVRVIGSPIVVQIWATTASGSTNHSRVSLSAPPLDSSCP